MMKGSNERMKNQGMGEWKTEKLDTEEKGLNREWLKPKKKGTGENDTRNERPRN